jgi:hypothetical protein
MTSPLNQLSDIRILSFACIVLYEVRDVNLTRK